MDQITKVMSKSMIVNIMLSIIKIIAGVLGQSSALIADGLHSFSDLATDLVAIVGNFLAKKPADEKHPYGHGKIEYVTSIIISFVILFLGFTIIYESTKKEIVIPSMITAIVSFFTILAKLFLSRYLIKKGKEYQNNILLASGYESSTDVISSIVVFVSVLLMQLSKWLNIFQYADIIASILVGILIIRIGFQVLKQNLSTILEEQETDESYLKQIQNIILKEDNIYHIDYLTVLKYGSYYKLIAEVSVDPNLTVMRSHQFIHEAENRLRIFDSKLLYITIHINPDQSYELKKAKDKDFQKIKNWYFETIVNKKISKKEKEEVENYIDSILEKHLNDFYMIYVNNKVVGTIGYYLKENIVFIEEIYIVQDYRNCEIGTSILKDLRKKYANKKIQLWVYKENILARHFYERIGFKIIEETEERMKMEL